MTWRPSQSFSTLGRGEIREILRGGGRKGGEFRLDTLLRLDAIERARQDVVREGGFRVVANTVEGLRGGRIEVLERELKNRREELSRLEREVSEVTRILEGKEKELGAVEGELNDLMTREQELEKLEKEYGELKQRLNALTEEESALVNELNTLKNSLRQLDKLRGGRISELERVVSREEELRGRIEELMRKRDEVKGKLALAQGARRRIEAISRELTGIDASIKELNNALDRVNQLRAKAEELRRRLARKASIEVEVGNAKDELARVNAEMEHLELELNLLREGPVEKCPLCGRPPG